jgi:hypothetical protein
LPCTPDKAAVVWCLCQPLLHMQLKPATCGDIDPVQPGDQAYDCPGGSSLKQGSNMVTPPSDSACCVVSGFGCCCSSNDSSLWTALMLNAAAAATGFYLAACA